MLKQILLHIGSEKTGTTAIQSYLAQNRGLLQQQQILYPSSVGNTNHFDICTYALNADKITPIRRRNNLLTKQQIKAFRKDVSKKLRKEINSARCDTLVLSNEQLSSNISSIEEALRVKSLLNEFSDNVKVIVYIRRQDQMAASAYSTEIKAGATHKFEGKGININSTKYNFKNLLTLWSDAFSRENMIVNTFPNSDFNGDVVQSFCSLAKINTQSFTNQVNKNESLGLFGLEALRKINKFLPKYGDSNAELRGNLQNIIVEAANSIDKRKLKIDPEISTNILNHFTESNEWVRRHYFPDNETLFEPLNTKLGSKEGIENNIEITDDAIYELVANIWLIKQQQFLNLKKHVQ